MNRRGGENGQSIILFAVALLGLVAMAGLMIDGGSLYLNRRRAQTAADAAALAAAHQKCIEQGNLVAVQNAAYLYAVTENHATAVDPVITDMNNRLGAVEVHTTVQTPSFFAKVLGQQNDTAHATASASCFPPATLGGILPVTWTCGLLAGEPISKCTIKSIPWSLFNGDIRFHYGPALGQDGSLILDEGDGTNYQTYADGSGAQLVTIPYDTSDKAWLSLDGNCTNASCPQGLDGDGGLSRANDRACMGSCHDRCEEERAK